MKPFGWLFRIIYRVVGFVTAILHPVTVEGMEKLPTSGAMLCSNHASNWDPVIIALRLPIDFHLNIMAKEQLFRIPVLKSLLPKVGAFPVNRGASDINAVKNAMRAIKNGENLLIFPEGTRVKAEGEEQAKGGIAVIAIRTGAVLVPVFVDGEKKLFRKTRLIFGDPYTPTCTGRHGTAEEVQEIADTVLRKAYDLGRVAPCQ